MRYLALSTWAAVTVVLMVIIISDFAFGKGQAKLLLKRLGLALVWPIACLSRPGRNLLFKEGKKL